MSKALGESKGWRSTSDWASWPWVGRTAQVLFGPMDLCCVMKHVPS